MKTRKIKIIDETLAYLWENENSMENYVNDTREEIARLITEGYTNGILSRDGMTCSWELKTNCFGEFKEEK